MNLANLTDDELLRHAHVQFEPLTGTALEAELLRRFEAHADTIAANAQVLTALDNLDLDLTKTKDVEKVTKLLKLVDEFDGWDIRALLELLSGQDLDNPEALRQVLERDAAMQSLLDDLADPIAKLHSLANPAPADAVPATTS